MKLWQTEHTLHTPHSTLHTPHSTLLSGIIVFTILLLIIGACSNPFYPVSGNSDAGSGFTPGGGTGGTPPEGMVWVAGGTFQMGSTTGETNEQPVHSVTLSGFYMGKYEVTQVQYEAVMGTNPSSFTTGEDAGETQSNRPVEMVSWYDAVEFCNKLSEQEGLETVYTISGRTPSTGYPITNATVTADFGKKGYRLPTEAEWEYAARGGNGSQGYTYAGSNNADAVAWYYSNSGMKTHEVGKKAANELGLYDMTGNVSEQCWDWYGMYLGTAQTNPSGVSLGSLRVARGGGWSYPPGLARSAYRDLGYPSGRSSGFGFRLVRPQF